MASESGSPTYPHDYRLICAGRLPPTIVGGQAVFLWAIAYLGTNDPDLLAPLPGSADLDILAEKEVLEYIKTVPGWVFRGRDIRNWADQRQGFFHSTSEDGRRLLVEVLLHVHGLTSDDLKHVEQVEVDGDTYRLLSPIAMLKSKAANVRDLKQDVLPPRHDADHLKLLARCVPLYLQNVHEMALRDPSFEKEALTILSYAFKTLQEDKTATTLANAGLFPSSLVPSDFGKSALPRLRRAYEHQFPRLRKPPDAGRSDPTASR